MLKFVVPLSAAVLLQGCAPILAAGMNTSTTDQSVRDKTAQYFSVPPEQIEVFDINKRALDTIYKTRFENKVYNCYVYYGDVQCKLPGT